MRTGPPTVVLATTNGKGMGHLSRQLALALASLGGMDPVIFSLSSAVPVVGDYGVRAEFCPGALRGQVPRPYWDAYLADRIVALIKETEASAFVFDGVYPYDGVLRALRRLPDVPFIWSRRAMWQKGKNVRALRYRRLFAAVLEPGDLAEPGDVGPTVGLDDARRLMPVTLVGNVPAVPRDQARQELGLDPDRPALLLTLGSNRRTDLHTAYEQTLRRFIEAGWQVAVTSSPLKEHAPAIGPTKVIRVFPLAKYLTAFDAAVSASGYNAVHESLYSALPTLFVPNPDAVTDDQVTRARVIAGQGLALSADPNRPREFEAALERLLDERVRARLIASCSDLEPTTGATEAARAVIGLAAGTRPAGSERVDAAALHAQRFTRRVVGKVLPAPVMKMLGGAPKPRRLTDLRGPLSLDLRLAPVEDHTAPPPKGVDGLLVTDALSHGLFEGRRVEHLLAGASDEYIADRAEIARHYYRFGRPADVTGQDLPPTAQRWAKLGWSPPET
jgi:glycosyl transferase family 28